MKKSILRLIAAAASLILCLGSACAIRFEVDGTEPGGGISASTLLYGIFLEDINHAVDGGLYAELVKNRSFEYGSAAANGSRHGWAAQEGVTLEVVDGAADGTALHENNPHYARIVNGGAEPAGILGTGFLDGMAVEAGKTYQFTVFMRADADPGAVSVSLRDTDGRVYAEAQIPGITPDWLRFTAVLRPSESVSRNLRLCLSVAPGAAVSADMISLMPADTYAALPVRRDLGQLLEDLHPAFLRFPGGCVIEGRSPETMYSWKASIGDGRAMVINGQETVGDIALRPQSEDIWSGTRTHPYYTTYGLGFYEYFCLCEALHCMPLPVLNAGMTCPVQSPHYTVYPLRSAEFRQCVQDALDLAEFCRGGADTRWGAVRIAMGHPEPFDLRYMAIGNEQWQSEYFDHYLAFVEAFDAAEAENPEIYGGIGFIVANGPTSSSAEGWDYVEGYVGAEDTRTALVDEHYYNSPEWFLTHTDRYDSYDRDLPAKVFLGEYASQSNQLISALAEAAFMTGLERNADVVSLACYAPLFGNATVNQWTPDLIFFNNTEAFGTVNYQVQRMFMANRPATVLPSALDSGAAVTQPRLRGACGLGSWQTAVAYDNLAVTDAATGETLFSADFDGEADLAALGLDVHTGNWAVRDGRLVQTGTGAPADENTGDALYFGDPAWTDVTLTVEAQITGGAEGFLIPVAVQDPENCIFWNLGGWGNTVSCLQIVSGGAKSGQVDGTVRNCRLQKGRTYTLKVSVEGARIRCWLDDELYVDYTKKEAGGLFASAGLSPGGDLILKLVNATGDAEDVETVLKGWDVLGLSDTATTLTLAGAGAAEANTFAEPDRLVPVNGTLPVAETFSVTLPPWSLTVIRVPALTESEAIVP